MKAGRLSGLALLLLALLAACAPGERLPGQAPATSAQPPALPNLLVEASGLVEVRRLESSRFVPVGLGAELQPGDTLRLVEGNAAVFCGDESLWDTSPRTLAHGKVEGVPCLVGLAPRPMPDILSLRAAQAGPPGESLHVLSPRTGFVSSERPALRWRPLPEVEEYRLSLASDDDLERPAVTARGGELAFPELWSPLQAGGASYLLIVEGGSRRSDEGEPPGLGFALLESPQRQRLEEQARHLQSRPIEEPGMTLLLAQLYLGYGLRSQVVELLLAAPGGERIAALQQLLGETYLAMGLFDEAQAAFRNALAAAEAARLPEQQAAAYFGLGLAACGRWEGEATQEHWAAALRLFEDLELSAQAGQVQERLLELRACSPPAPLSPTP